MYFGQTVQPRPKKVEKNVVFQCHRLIEAPQISGAKSLLKGEMLKPKLLENANLCD